MENDITELYYFVRKSIKPMFIISSIVDTAITADNTLCKQRNITISNRTANIILQDIKTDCLYYVYIVLFYLHLLTF